MPNDLRPPSTMVAMTADGVTVLLDMSHGRLPAIVHWGHELPELASDTTAAGDSTAAGHSTAAAGDIAAALVAAMTPVPGPNDVDEPVRLAILPEQAAAWSGRPGLQGSRAGRDWSPYFTTTAITLDGEPVDGFASSGPATLQVEAIDDEAHLGLALTIELLPGGLLRARAAVTNHGDEPWQVDHLAVAFPVPPEASELLDFAGRWTRERIPQRRNFTVGTHLRENRKGRTGADSAYLLHAGTPGFDFAHGEVFAVHTAWSGNHVHYAERTFDGHRVLGGGELLLPGEVRLDHGQTHTSPWIFAAHGVGLDQVAHRFHRHLRDRARPVTANRPITLNVWEAVYFDHDHDRLRDLATRAADLGVERYVLDDGWFGGRRNDRAGLGDWVVSPDVWPDGLHPLVDHVRGLGMVFGLWFEPEMVNPDSDLARAHPEWIMAAREQWPVESRHQQVLDIGIPEAYDHILEQILAILDEYPIDFIKWDHNRDLVEAGNQLDGGRPGVHDQTAAFHRMLRAIREAHPGIEVESCSSGGARIDLAVLEHADRVWVSDCIDPLERQHIARWTTQLIPPEFMGAHIASGRSHTTGRVHDLNFRAGTAVFGHLGIEWDLARATEEELAELREWLDFYTANRDLLMAGTVVRVDTHDDHLFVHGVVAPDQARAIFAMATVGSLDASPGPRLRLRGLDPDRLYRIRPILVGPGPSGLVPPPWWGDPSGGDDGQAFPGTVLSGRALEQVGVAPPIVHPDQVVLFDVRVEGDG